MESETNKINLSQYYVRLYTEWFLLFFLLINSQWGNFIFLICIIHCLTQKNFFRKVPFPNHFFINTTEKQHFVLYFCIVLYCSFEFLEAKEFAVLFSHRTTVVSLSNIHLPLYNALQKRLSPARKNKYNRHFPIIKLRNLGSTLLILALSKRVSSQKSL